MRAGRGGSGPGAPLVSVAMIRHRVVVSGTVLRLSLRSPGRAVAITAPAGLLILLGLGPAFAQSGALSPAHPPALAGDSAPGKPAPAVAPTDRPQPPPPLLAPGAAALLGGPEPLQIGGPQGAAPVPLTAPWGGPVAPGAAPFTPLAKPAAPSPPRPGGPPVLGVQAPGAPALAAPAPGAPALAPATVAPPPPTTLVLDRRRRLLTVLENGQPLRRFPVAVGMPGWETPVGSFRVLEKTVNPIWEHPQKGTQMASGPANPLGSRWIGFYQDCQGRRGWDGQQMLDVKGCVVAGFHGTPNRWTVGQAVSHGCVRLYDEDVRALFDLVTLGTPVMVLP